MGQEGKQTKSTKRIKERKDTGKRYREAKMIYKKNLPKRTWMEMIPFLRGKLSQSRENLI